RNLGRYRRQSRCIGLGYRYRWHANRRGPLPQRTKPRCQSRGRGAGRFTNSVRCKPGPHKIQGIGANFVPEVLDTELYSSVYTATLEESIQNSRLLGAKEGILGGISSGAAIAAALEEAEKEENAGK